MNVLQVPVGLSWQLVAAVVNYSLVQETAADEPVIFHRVSVVSA